MAYNPRSGWDSMNHMDTLDKQMNKLNVTSHSFINMRLLTIWNKPENCRTCQSTYLGPTTTTCKILLKDSRISIWLRKYEVSVEGISVCNVIKKWRSMAHTVCHGPEPMTSLCL